MIEKTIKIGTAKCDACGLELSRECQPNAVHYGLLKNCFGYGSKFDNLDVWPKEGMHLCEDCYEKAMKALGFKWNGSKIK